MRVTEIVGNDEVLGGNIRVVIAMPRGTSGPWSVGAQLGAAMATASRSLRQGVGASTGQNDASNSPSVCRRSAQRPGSCRVRIPIRHLWERQGRRDRQAPPVVGSGRSSGFPGLRGCRGRSRVDSGNTAVAEQVPIRRPRRGGRRHHPHTRVGCRLDFAPVVLPSVVPLRWYDLSASARWQMTCAFASGMRCS